MVHGLEKFKAYFYLNKRIVKGEHVDKKIFEKHNSKPIHKTQEEANE